MTIAEIERALARLPRKLLCSFETPVERLYRLEEELNAGPVYIKRDDLNGLGPGGNKVRPLEYLLGEAMERRCDTIIASGMENSNLCSIAAAACAVFWSTITRSRRRGGGTWCSTNWLMWRSTTSDRFPRRSGAPMWTGWQRN